MLARMGLFGRLIFAIGITSGQVKTEEKSNEITAIPEQLNLLTIKGCAAIPDWLQNALSIPIPSPKIIIYYLRM